MRLYNMQNKSVHITLQQNTETVMGYDVFIFDAF